MQKDNENKGKWFRKCAKPQGRQCTFWLWEHAAEALEKKAREREAQERAATEREEHSSTYSLYSRLASTVESEPLLSPDVGMTPVPRQRIFRGIPQMAGVGTRSGGLGGGWDSEDSDFTEQGANQAGMGQLQPSLFQNQALAAPNPNKDRPVPKVGAGTSFGNLSGVTVVLDDSDTDKVMEAPGPAQRPAQAQRNEVPVTPSRRATRMGPGELPTPQPSRNTLLIASGSTSKKRKIAPGMSIPSPKTPTRTRNALGPWEESTVDDSQDDRERDWHLLVEEVRVIREDLRLVRERRRMDREKIQGLKQELKMQSSRMAELETLVVSLQASKSTGAIQNPFQDTVDG